MTVSEGDVGAFGELIGDIGDDLTAHHMPQDALGFLPRKEGGCIIITTGEHVKTRTYGGKGASTKVTDKGRPFADVLQDNIDDLKSITGDKYTKSIDNLIDFYDEKGMLNKDEVAKLKAHNHH